MRTTHGWQTSSTHCPKRLTGRQQVRLRTSSNRNSSFSLPPEGIRYQWPGSLNVPRQNVAATNTDIFFVVATVGKNDLVRVQTAQFGANPEPGRTCMAPTLAGKASGSATWKVRSRLRGATLVQARIELELTRRRHKCLPWHAPSKKTDAGFWLRSGKSDIDRQAADVRARACPSPASEKLGKAGLTVAGQSLAGTMSKVGFNAAPPDLYSPSSASLPYSRV